MPLYDAENHIASDPCALRARDDVNRGLLGYQIAQYRPACDDPSPCKDPRTAAVGHRNLRPWDGFGIHACAIDGDSSLRNGSATHPRQRTQLPKRIFSAVPNLARGTPAPDVESRLFSGHSTSMHRTCDRLSEKAFDVFNPALSTVPVEHIVPTWTAGGAPSRSISRSPEFLQSMGFVHDGRTWRRGPTAVGGPQRPQPPAPVMV